MANPMKITDEMIKTRKRKLDEFVEQVNEKIRWAISNGLNETTFMHRNTSDENRFYMDVMEIFKKSGYVFRRDEYGNDWIGW